MKRVLIIATSPQTRGGITSVVRAHSQGRQWDKYHCYWLATHRDSNAFIKILLLLRALVIGLFLIPFYGIIHIHFSEPPSAIRKMLFLIISKIYRKNVILHFHSFSVNTTIKGKYAWVYRFLFLHADVAIVLSNYWKQMVDSEYHLGDKIKVIYNPCTTNQYSTKYEKEKTILYAGALNHRKGYADLIKAFSRIAKKYPEWKIVLAGNGEIEEGKKLANDFDISNQVQFLGWVTGEQKDAAYKKASVFCLPSYAEGFPMAVLDAWAYGLPVITTPVGGIPDIANDGENLLLFEPGDVMSLSQCLEKLIVDEGIRQKLGMESIKLASYTFNVETICNQLSCIYEKLFNS